MDYIGSKAKIDEWIFDIVSKYVPSSQGLIFLDGCSGSGVISRFAALRGFDVIANDILMFPSVIANGSIGSDEHEKAIWDHIRQMRKLKGKKGFFYSNFSPASNPPRMYFTSENAQKIDGYRDYIEHIEDQKIKDALLWRCLEALSSVSNTAGVHGAFLKTFKPRTKDDISKSLIWKGSTSGLVRSYCGDLFSLVDELEHDILYIDPPYTTRQYGPNYHLYETFVRNDNPPLSGQTGLRPWKDESDSKFCSKKLCCDFLKQIVSNSKARWVFMSYNSDGLLSKQSIQDAFTTCGFDVESFELKQRRYRSDAPEARTYNHEPLYEYLFAAER